MMTSPEREAGHDERDVKGIRHANLQPFSRIEDNDCRMYENPYPDVDDYVIVEVTKMLDTCAYVELLEYKNIEGMVLFSELSRRARSINRLTRLGRQDVMVVLRVDKDKGYIDLSKRRATLEDVNKAEERYHKSKVVHGIMRHVSETCGVRLEQLYKDFGWDLYRRFGHAYVGFKLTVGNPDESGRVLDRYNMPENVRRALLVSIERHMTPRVIRIRADLELSCFSYEGIDAIKAALAAGKSAGTAENQVNVKLVASPLYVMFTTSTDEEEGIALLRKALDAIHAVIVTAGGSLNIKNEPRAVTDRDDHMLQLMMEELEEQGREVDGDSLSDDAHS